MQRRQLLSGFSVFSLGAILPVTAAEARPRLLEFWASWCGICRTMEPTVAALKERWGKQVEIQIVDVDDPKKCCPGPPVQDFWDGYFCLAGWDG